jgi:hypothetical protein
VAGSDQLSKTVQPMVGEGHGLPVVGVVVARESGPLTLHPLDQIINQRGDLLPTDGHALGGRRSIDRALCRELIPARSSQRVSQLWNDAQMRAAIMDMGAEYVSTWDVMCNADGCLTRLGENPEDITASDAHHLTESGSKFFN